AAECSASRLLLPSNRTRVFERMTATGQTAARAATLPRSLHRFRPMPRATASPLFSTLSAWFGPEPGVEASAVSRQLPELRPRPRGLRTERRPGSLALLYCRSGIASPDL